MTGRCDGGQRYLLDHHVVMEQVRISSITPRSPVVSWPCAVSRVWGPSVITSTALSGQTTRAPSSPLPWSTTRSAPHLATPGRRPFGGQAVQRRLEAGQATRAPVPDLAVGPVLQDRAGLSRREVHYILPGGGGQDPTHLLAPTSSPETKCR